MPTRLLRFLLALVVIVPLIPSGAHASPVQPYTWRLLNTWVYQGLSWGSTVLNMEGGRANGLMTANPSFTVENDLDVWVTAYGEVSILGGQSRTWVASPLSPDAVDFGTRPWTIEFGGRSTIGDIAWIPGSFDPEELTFTPASGTPVATMGSGSSTFVPSSSFVIPAGMNPAVKVSATTAPSLVDTYDVLNERSPSSLSVADGVDLETDTERVQSKMQKARCDNREVTGETDCPEAWVLRTGAPVAGAADLVAAPDGRALYTTGWIASASGSDQDMLTVAIDPLDGAILWQDRYNGPGGPQDRPRTLLVSPDGSTVYVVGTVCVVPTSGNLNCTSEEDIATIAYNAATGTRRWVRTVGGAGSQRASAAALSPDGSTLIVGGTTAPIAGPSDPQDVYVTALDTSNGATRWSGGFAGASSLWDYPTGIAFAGDGANAYVVGGTKSSQTKLDALVLGFDAATGARILTRIVDGGAAGDDTFSGIAVADDTLYATGNGVQPGAGASDALTFALDLTQRDEVWRVWHDGLWSGADSSSFVAVSNGTVFVGGIESRTSVFNSAYAAAYDDTDGTQRWIHRFARPGLSHNGLWSMRLTPDGSSLLLAMYGGWFGDETRDFVSLVLDTSTGTERFLGIYDGPKGGRDRPAGIVSSPDGSRIIVVGMSEGYESHAATLGIFSDLTAVAYDIG